jgi:UDP-glucose 4-epimerase
MLRTITCWLVAIFTAISLKISSAETKRDTILVVGGAGFIGAHVNSMLHERGYDTVVLDNLSRGHRETVEKGVFIAGDNGNSALLDSIFTKYSIQAVMHFAAFKCVSESISDPLKYYHNNIGTTLNLLSAMQRHGVNIFIFSSSASIFGSPVAAYINEEHRTSPLSPYGNSKLLIEKILPDCDKAYGLRYCSLRYFNAAGGDPAGLRKQYCYEDCNLIPTVLSCLKNNAPITIFGTDYPTPDGTCIRDYIHIEDLGEAHIKAMEKLMKGASSTCYNLGNGQGFSVQEVITTAEKITGKQARIIYGPRRTGDAAIVIADATKARQELGWEPCYSSLQGMIEHMWHNLKD